MTYDSLDWGLVSQQVQDLAHEPHWLPALANIAALLGESLADINWVGFYLAGSLLEQGLRSDELILGPFQGNVACVRIPWGRGVCGTAAQKDQTLRVDDVHAFPGHIACDAASRSEVVVPLRVEGHVVGVLDVDSPLPARFSDADVRGLEACAHAAEEAFVHLAE